MKNIHNGHQPSRSATIFTDVSATHDSVGYKESDAATKLFLNGVTKFKQMYERENSW